MRFSGTYLAAGMGALVLGAALGACSYDFDGLVAHTGPGGTAGNAGSAGAGAGGSSGAGGLDDGGMSGAAGKSGAAGSGGVAGKGGAAGSAGKAGASGSAGKGGTAGTGADAGRGGGAGTADAGKGGSAGAADAGKGDTAADRSADVRAETSFDCTAVGGTDYLGHCYYLSPATTNWDTAKTTGCAAPSHLVVITNAGEQAVVAAILPGQERWIGLRKELPPNMESSFRWVTGEALTYKTWDSYDSGAPEPNYTGDCVRMRFTDNWGDTACTDLYAAVCEYE